jgi:predicted nucleic acid-binding Zn ribbon protein
LASTGVSIMSTYIFACPGCEEEIEVNDSMRSAILSSGCPICTEPIEPADFEPA